MGGFSSFKKKFKKYTGVSLEGASIGGTTGLLFGDKIVDFVKDPTGAKKAAKTQADALRAAGKFEEAHRLELETARAEYRAETSQFREQGSLELERLRGQTPGSTEFYKQALSRGTEDIIGQRDRFGLAESGRTGTQFEELGSNLLLQEELARQQGIGRAANLAQTGYGTDLELLRQKGGAAYRQAQTTADIGAAKAQGSLANRQFYTGLATQGIGAAAGYFTGGASTAAAGAAGAAQAPAQGGYGSSLQYPQYNQFQSPYGG